MVISPSSNHQILGLSTNLLKLKQYQLTIKTISQGNKYLSNVLNMIY